jgi:hypothetical protein
MEEEDDGPLLVVVAAPLFRKVNLETVCHPVKFDTAVEEAGLLWGLGAGGRRSYMGARGCGRSNARSCGETQAQHQGDGRANNRKSKKTEHIKDSDAGSQARHRPGSWCIFQGTAHCNPFGNSYDFSYELGGTIKVL